VYALQNSIVIILSMLNLFSSILNFYMSITSKEWRALGNSLSPMTSNPFCWWFFTVVVIIYLFLTPSIWTATVASSHFFHFFILRAIRNITGLLQILFYALKLHQICKSIKEISLEWIWKIYMTVAFPILYWLNDRFRKCIRTYIATKRAKTKFVKKGTVTGLTVV